MPHLGTPAPGSASRLPPRAWLRSDAPQHSLDGDWDFRLHPGDPLDHDDGPPPFASTGGEAGADFSPIRVPGHWVLQGFDRPIYTNIQYPFPTDPPHVPDENPTGDHRRTFRVPESFAGAARVLLRFDGVESLATVWLNGAEVGWFTGSRLATEFDVTALLRTDGENLLAVRVHQWSAASYVENQDQWWLPGIFRSVTLLARPADALDDVGVRADFDHRDGSGILFVDPVGAFPVTVRVPELGIERVFATPEEVAPIAVPAVAPWSAEVPRLYDATVATAGETVSLRLGFRTVRITGDRMLVNGEPITFRGVNRHETHPDRGRVHDDADARADLVSMKQYNVNAIRTAHQPPHPAVLEMADELGLWVVLECDLETHGFWDVEWRGNPSDDSDWRDAYLDRVARTVERDKNHASVVLWSLGNESGTGRNLAAMAAWIRDRDDSRPIHYEGDYEGAYTDVYSRMYPTLEEIHSICGEQTMPVHEVGPVEGARQRARPFLMCEYGHAMGNGPGALADYEELVDRYPRHHGGFVWEWRDHGLRTRTPEGVEYFAYGGDFGEVVHDGIFIMDGLVLSDGTPTPGLAEFAAVSAPVVLTVEDGGIRVRNRRHSASTGDLLLAWRVEDDGRVVARGELDSGPVPAGAELRLAFPALGALPPLDGERWLIVEACTATESEWAPIGHVVSRGERLLDERHRAPSRRRVLWKGDTLGEARFSASGELVALGDLPLAGPRLELWRAPTENDRGAGQGSYELADAVLSHGRGAEEVPPAADRWRERGLDRLMHRTLSTERRPDGLVRRVRSMAANAGIGVDTTFRWSSGDEGLVLRTEVEPFGVWDCTWPRIGIRFDLPADLAEEEVRWFGTGPSESYSDSRAAAHVGRFTAAVDDLSVDYARPQETGHRPELRELVVGPLTVRTRPDARGHRAGFQLSRHTAQERSRAEHPHELPPSTGVFLYLDDAQHGIGSRACGPDVLPKDALWPGAHVWEVVLS